jgi:molybdate transport system substrate-binding protein
LHPGIITTPGIVLAAPLPPGCDMATVYSCAIAAMVAAGQGRKPEFIGLLTGARDEAGSRQLGFSTKMTGSFNKVDRCAAA